MKATFIPVLLLVALSLSACAAEQAYNTGQAWQRNQCNKLPDKAEFDRCMRDSNTTYEAYKRKREPEQK